MEGYALRSKGGLPPEELEAPTDRQTSDMTEYQTTAFIILATQVVGYPNCQTQLEDRIARQDSLTSVDLTTDLVTDALSSGLPPVLDPPLPKLMTDTACLT